MFAVLASLYELVPICCKLREDVSGAVCGLYSKWAIIVLNSAMRTDMLFIILWKLASGCKVHGGL